MTEKKAPNYGLVVWIVLYLAMMIWSGIGPKDRLTWWLEVFPTLIGVVVMAATYKRFRLSPLLYVVILVHSLILYVGGHYTYAETPLPNLFGDLFGAGRNNFDKIGHIFQGITPALVMRELLIRTSPMVRSKWLGFLSVCVAMAVSAFYELIEWWSALIYGAAGDAFLGMQGYIWDTQSDMFMALCGSTCAVIIFGRWQRKMIEKIEAK